MKITDFPVRLLLLVAALLAASALAEDEGESEKNKAHRNTLKWSTASEVDNFGFDVYRGDSEEGPFVRLTENPVPGAGTTDEPSRYQYVDDTIDPYEAYWYYVESISFAGVRERFTPVFRAKPKLGDDEASEEGEEEADGAGRRTN